jgi:peroxiredoxin
VTRSGRQRGTPDRVRAPQFDLMATDGEQFSLDSFSPDQLLVLVFLANHCPFVTAWEDRLIMLAIEHAGRGAAFAAVCSSDSRKYPEDSFEEMRRRVHEKHYPFPYLYDGEGALASALGATTTPEAFVFDHDRALRYHGAIDSDPRDDHHPTPYLRDAVELLIRGQSPQTVKTEPIGCPIERND